VFKSDTEFYHVTVGSMRMIKVNGQSHMIYFNGIA